MKSILVCPLPPTLNDQIEYARTSKYKSAEVKKEWTKIIVTIAYSLEKFEGKVWLDFLWKVKNFGRDADNIWASAKYVMDGLVKAEKLKQDSLMIIQSPTTHHYERTKGDDTLVLTIGDKPIYTLTLNIEQEDLAA